MLNKAQEAAAKTGNNTTKSLVSAIGVKPRLHILHNLFRYYYTHILYNNMQAFFEIFTSINF